VRNDVGRVRVVASIGDLQRNEVGECALTHVRETIIFRDKMLPLGILEVVVRTNRGVVEEGILGAKLGILVC